MELMQLRRPPTTRSWTAIESGRYLEPVVEKLDFLDEFPNSYGKKAVMPKIIIKGMTLLDACIDRDGSVIPGKTTLVCTSNQEQHLKAALAIINSKLPIFYIRERYSSCSYNGGINFSKDMINRLPLPSTVEQCFVQLERLTDYVVLRKSYGMKTEHFEMLVDAIMYELYFPEEVRAANCEVLEQLSNLPKLENEFSDDKKLQIVEDVYKKLSDTKHPVSAAMSRMADIEEIRIIEGRQQH